MIQNNPRQYGDILIVATKEDKKTYYSWRDIDFSTDKEQGTGYATKDQAQTAINELKKLPEFQGLEMTTEKYV